MKLEDLIQVASDAYDEDLISQAAEQQTGELGPAYDGLAIFAASEIKETFDEDSTDLEQLEEARRVMQVAADELQAVADALARKIWTLGTK